MGDVMLTAHDMDRMEDEAEAFIEEIFFNWMVGHFGSRLRLDTEAEVEDGASLVRPTGAGPAGQTEGG